jgi:hypothetical protein
MWKHAYTGKHIMNQEMIHSGHSDSETSMSQEKQIEVLMTHIRRLNSTLADCRKKERLTAETNEGEKWSYAQIVVLSYFNFHLDKIIFNYWTSYLYYLNHLVSHYHQYFT